MRAGGCGQAVLDALREVSVDDWLTAMPASVVRPDDIDAVAAEMLADVLTPDGFDATKLVAETGARDRNVLAGRLTGAVACEWIGLWIDATRAGDETAAAEAAAALASSHDWAILREMHPDGGYLPVVWEYADAVAGDGLLPDGTPVDEVLPAGHVEGDTVFGEPVEAYKLTLGCD